MEYGVRKISYYKGTETITFKGYVEKLSLPGTNPYTLNFQ